MRATAVLTVASAVGYVIDDRVVMGAQVWATPLEFAMSFGLNAVTLGWLTSRLRGPRLARIARPTGTVVAVASTLELAAVVGQAVRGQASRFNQATPKRATTLAIRSGLAISVLGMSVGSLMLAPTPRQRADPDSTMTGAHSVGVPDGVPSIPLVGWATTGGELRISHFVGLHALQLLPLPAAVLSAVPALRPRHRTRSRLILIAAMSYTGCSP